MQTLRNDQRCTQFVSIWGKISKKLETLKFDNSKGLFFFCISPLFQHLGAFLCLAKENILLFKLFVTFYILTTINVF